MDFDQLLPLLSSGTWSASVDTKQEAGTLVQFLGEHFDSEADALQHAANSGIGGTPRATFNPPHEVIQLLGRLHDALRGSVAKH